MPPFYLPSVAEMDAKAKEEDETFEAGVAVFMDEISDSISNAFRQQGVPLVVTIRVDKHDRAENEAWKRFKEDVVTKDRYNGRYVLTTKDPCYETRYLATVQLKKGSNYNTVAKPEAPRSISGTNPPPPPYEDAVQNSSICPVCCIIL